MFKYDNIHKYRQKKGKESWENRKQGKQVKEANNNGVLWAGLMAVNQSSDIAMGESAHGYGQLVT